MCCDHIVAPKRVTGGGGHLSGLAPGQHSSEEISQRWRAVGNTVYDLTGPGMEPQTSSADSDVLPLLEPGVEILVSNCVIFCVQGNLSRTLVNKNLTRTMVEFVTGMRNQLQVQ